MFVFHQKFIIFLDLVLDYLAVQRGSDAIEISINAFADFVGK